jgi:hypothetical protein
MVEPPDRNGTCWTAILPRKKRPQIAAALSFFVPEGHSVGIAHFLLCKARRLCYTLPGANIVSLCSSVAQR